MRRLVFLGPLALVWLLPASAQAEFIPWKYNWSRSPATINADAPGTGFITLTDEKVTTAAGDTDVVATNLKIFSTAPPGTPDVFTAKAYALTVSILDQESGMTGTLTFTGELSGTASSSSAKIANKFTGMMTQSMLLGVNRYDVTIGPYSPPGPPEGGNSGSIAAMAHVEVTDITKSPEPSTLVLAAIGAPLAVWWRRRKSKK